MYSMTLLRVSFPILPFPDIARETVVFETPNASATSAMVISFFSSFSIVTSNSGLSSGVPLILRWLRNLFLLSNTIPEKSIHFFTKNVLSYFAVFTVLSVVYSSFLRWYNEKAQAVARFLCQHVQNNYFL